jgi:parallel beta-helix repeat protein
VDNELEFSILVEGILPEALSPSSTILGMGMVLSRLASGVFLIMLLFGTFASVSKTQIARASEPSIYIMPDGAVNGTTNINTSDNITYFFTANIDYQSIIVQRNNIAIDGGGFTLNGGGNEKGASWNDIDNVTVKNLNIQGFITGIQIENSTHNKILNTNITANSGFGIHLESSSDNILSNNNVTANGSYTNGGFGLYLNCSSNNVLSDNNVTANYEGIDLFSSSGNILSGNKMKANTNNGILLTNSSDSVLTANEVSANGGEGIVILASSGNNLQDNNVTANRVYGIVIEYSSNNNTLSGNVMASNRGDFGVLGNDLSDFTNYIDTSNFADGKPIYYLMNQSDITISPAFSPSGIGYLGLVNCRNVTVQGLTLTKNVLGLQLANVTNSRIINNNVSANIIDGIYLCNSSGNTVSGNSATASDYYGIHLFSSLGNTVSGNNFTGNSFAGIHLASSYGNTVSGNNAVNNGNGVFLESSSGNTVAGNNVTANYQGIYLGSAPGNVFSNNNVTGNINEGIFLASSDNNSITGNNVLANKYYGIWLQSSSNNTIYHNSFVDNTNQVRYDSSPNNWDNGYPSGGNYWSDYQTRYPGASENDSSGIWNTPYVINSNNTDHYPLMHTQVISEIQPLLILPLFIVATLFAAIAYRRRRERITFSTF